ncbi:MAG: AAA family ATPase [Lachnospiraceae bacterium]|nr:AAA family ATPase [Lachnospiraceae bacterium]
MRDNNANVDMEPQFREWLTGMQTKEGVRLYTDNMIISYSHALRRTCYKIEPYIAGNLFLIHSAYDFDEVYDKIVGSFDYEQVDKESNGTFSVSLKLYQAFLRRDDNAARKVGEEMKEAAAAAQAAAMEAQAQHTYSPAQDHSHLFDKNPHEVLHLGMGSQNSSTASPSAPADKTASQPVKPEEPVRLYESRKRRGLRDEEENEAEPEEEAFRYTEVPMTPIQKIYYGAPGTGKSYSVNQILEKIYPKQEERDSHCRRLIFHPTYSYEDFVGSIKPLATTDRPLDYVFVAGPLTLLLKDAFMHPYETFYLVIEEINRGNTPAIFGDLFQLLDRQSSGKSAYAIQNSSIVTYFSRDPGLKNLFREGKIWFPANLSILATMNTADENIFVLDNAFKRRFALEYVPIEFDDVPEDWSREYEIFKGSQPLISIFQDTPLEEYARQLEREGKLRRNWPTFARLTNKLMDIMNKQAIQAGNLRLTRIPENRKLGTFFLSRPDLIRREAFINKVVFYLKQDVFNTSDHYLTDSFEDIYDKYRTEEYDLFELLR